MQHFGSKRITHLKKILKNVSSLFCNSYLRAAYRLAAIGMPIAPEGSLCGGFSPTGCLWRGWRIHQSPARKFESNERLCVPCSLPSLFHYRCLTSLLREFFSQSLRRSGPFLPASCPIGLYSLREIPVLLKLTQMLLAGPGKCHRISEFHLEYR